MNKNRMKLTESQLHKIIKESVKNIINESWKYSLIDTAHTKIVNYMDMISRECDLEWFYDKDMDIAYISGDKENPNRKIVLSIQ